MLKDVDEKTKMPPCCHNITSVSLEPLQPLLCSLFMSCGKWFMPL